MVPVPVSVARGFGRSEEVMWLTEEDTRSPAGRPSLQIGGNPVYVRITRGRFQPERIDDVEALSSDIVEAIKILPGFLGYQGGVDRNTSTIVAISNWEDRGSAEFPRDKLGDVLGRITALVQLEPAEIYKTSITA
jgi:hypothetical protein